MDLLKIVVHESEQSIDRAFDEGYKRGLLATAPETEYWKLKAQATEEKLVQYKKTKWLYMAGGFGMGFMAGGAATIAIRLER